MTTIIDSISKELDYSQVMSSHSSPAYVKLNSISNITSFTPSISSVSQLTEFLLPARVLSLKKSRLNFSVNFPGQGASLFTYVQGNALTMIDRIVLTSTSTNTTLCDISNFSRYASMISPVATTFSEVQNKASSVGTSSVTAIAPMQVSATLADQYKLEDVSRCNQLINPDGLNVEPACPYFYIKKNFVSTAVNTANFLSFNIPLDAIQYSIFDVDKLLYFGGENIMMSIYWSPANKYTWVGTSATNPSTAAAVITVAPIISNLSLYCYVEQNNDIITNLVSKVNTEGVSINFPYPQISRYNLSGSSQSFTINLGRSYGKSLLFTLVSPFNTTESNNTAQDHGSAINLRTNFTACNYNTFLNATPITSSSNIDVFQSEPWIYNKFNLYNSAIQSLPAYDVDFVHIDNFMGKSLAEADRSASDGYVLDTNSQYQFQLNGVGTGNVINWYIAIVGLKTLNLSANGVSVS